MAKPVRVFKRLQDVIFVRFFMVINLYPPEIHSPGQELAPSPPWRVASGSLSLISRRFFINQNPFEELILVFLPNNVANIVHVKANLQIKFQKI
jgi:hypothetical protein